MPTSTDLTANQFIDRLTTHQSLVEAGKNRRYFTEQTNTDNQFLGIRMKIIFDTAKEFTGMPLGEIEQLMESPFYEVRMGAVSMMDFKARNKNSTEADKKELFDLYINHPDRINNWDMVDRAAPFVVGGYLFNKPRAPLYKLAKSKNLCERRTAIVSTYYFIRKGDVSDTFKIAALLVNDPHPLIHKAVGSWTREAGKKDKAKLIQFLNQYGSVMPRTMLRYAIEQLDQNEKEFYMQMKPGK